MDAEIYARAADVANVRARTLPSGRAVERDEVRALFAACDDSPAGRRDAAMLAVHYGGGLRRAELCGLDVADFDAGECSITVRSGKGRRDRRVFLSKRACGIVKRWISARVVTFAEGQEDLGNTVAGGCRLATSVDAPGSWEGCGSMAIASGF